MTTDGVAQERAFDEALRVGTRTMAALDSARLLVERLTLSDLHITAVESCTGGAFIDMLTSVSGSSAVVEDASITYSNHAKIALGVPPEVIDEYTVYSRETAAAMARVGLERSVCADIGVGITGSLSRVDPANPENSVPGQVYLGVVYGAQLLTARVTIPEEHRFEAKLSVVAKAMCAVDTVLERAAAKGQL